MRYAREDRPISLKHILVHLYEVLLIDCHTEVDKVHAEELLERISVVLRVYDGFCLKYRDSSTCTRAARTLTLKFYVEGVGSVGVEIVASNIEGFVQWEAVPKAYIYILSCISDSREKFEVLNCAVLQRNIGISDDGIG